MNGTEISILKPPNEISFSGLLKSNDSAALEPQINLEILSDFSHQPLERKLPDQELGTLLVLSDFSQSHSSWPETVTFLHSSGCRSRYSLEILRDFSHQPLERKLPDQKLGTLLVLSDFSQSHSSWPETMRLLHSSGYRSRFVRGLCG
ncbi:Uncharacterized protein TCM_025598 [Theobroma cacao]|uniref:Uncharacterized protein n=1 Tax=Theobroma cacao TaxID=3641 RepID=A0A061F0Q3_THECC|nr:Uncharacterized protein TCM_025598 [Theobroma cacao]